MDSKITTGGKTEKPADRVFISDTLEYSHMPERPRPGPTTGVASDTTPKLVPAIGAIFQC